jgi:pyruvate dehydrogenase E1 component beta subunit
MRINYNQSIQNSLEIEMQNDPQILLLGLGISDPKRFFGTTYNLVEKYSLDRVIECPTSENAYLGHGLGLALLGFKPIIHFQRMDFMLYAFDQLVNNIAKWEDMFNRKKPIHLTIRTLIGMGWGQGAQHSQNFSAFFSHIPGLIVTAPSCPESANMLLKKSIHYGKPIIQVEHRWLQYLNMNIENKNASYEIGKAKIRKAGNKVTILSWSYGTVEALRFESLFPELELEIIDLLTLYPLDIKCIKKSIQKNKKIIIWESDWKFAGFGAELYSIVHENEQMAEILRLGYKHKNICSSHLKLNDVYLNLEEIVNSIGNFLGIKLDISAENIKKWPKDQDMSNWSPWDN